MKKIIRDGNAIPLAISKWTINTIKSFFFQSDHYTGQAKKIMVQW